MGDGVYVDDIEQASIAQSERENETHVGERWGMGREQKQEAEWNFMAQVVGNSGYRIPPKTGKLQIMPRLTKAASPLFKKNLKVN